MVQPLNESWCEQGQTAGFRQLVFGQLYPCIREINGSKAKGGYLHGCFINHVGVQGKLKDPPCFARSYLSLTGFSVCVCI